MHHADIHPPKIRHQPDQPDDDAVTVKLLPQGFLFFPDHISSPGRMDQHEPQRDLAGEGMGFPKVKRPISYAMHHPGAKKVEKKTSPESNNMPRFKIKGYPFCPDPE